MTLEVEQKFPVADLDALAARLAELGARFHDPVQQCDQYFGHPARDYARTDEALRIRRVGSESLLTYKGPKIDLATKTRHEIELPLGTGDAVVRQWTDLLLAIGFSPVAEVRKERRPLSLGWHNWTVSGALDRVERLGTFAELELVVEPSDAAEAKQVILSLCAELGLADPERRSYLEMLQECREG